MSKRDILLGFLCALLWGANFPLVKIVLEEMPPTLATAFRLGLMGLIGLYFVKIPKGQWKGLFFLTLTLYSAPLILITYAIEIVDQTIISIITNFEIIFALLIDVLIFKTVVRRNEIIGIIFAFIGVNIIIISPEISGVNYLGLILAGLAAVLYTISSFQIKYINLRPLSITVWAAIIGAIQCFIFAAFDNSYNDFNALGLGNKTLVAIFLSSCSSLAAFFLWSFLLRNNNVYKVTVFVTLIPISSLVVSYFAFGELVHWKALIGGGICVLGMLYQSIPSKTKEIEVNETELETQK